MYKRKTNSSHSKKKTLLASLIKEKLRKTCYLFTKKNVPFVIYLCQRCVAVQLACVIRLAA